MLFQVVYAVLLIKSSSHLKSASYPVSILFFTLIIFPSTAQGNGYFLLLLKQKKNLLVQTGKETDKQIHPQNRKISGAEGSDSSAKAACIENENYLILLIIKSIKKCTRRAKLIRSEPTKAAMDSG